VPLVHVPAVKIELWSLLALFALACAGLSVTSGCRSECSRIQARFEETVDRASRACRQDGDCGCFNPVVEDLGCGGVTDRGTAGRLARLEHEFHSAGCEWPHQCPAMACMPRCVAGRCTQ